MTQMTCTVSTTSVSALSGVQRLKNMLGDTHNVCTTSVSQLCLDSGICWVTQMACLRSVR